MKPFFVLLGTFVVTKKNSHVNATESLWLLKKVGLHFSTCFVASELKTIKKLIANIIIMIPTIKYLLNKQQKK